MSQFALEVVGQHAAVDGGEVASDDFILIEPDLLEDALVELAADNVVGRPVVAVGVDDERRPVAELAIHELGTRRVEVKCLLGSGAFDGDTGLLLAKHVEGDGVAVVSLEELPALVVEPIHLSLRGGDLAGAEWQDDLDVLPDSGADLFGDLFGEGDGAPVGLDEVLDHVGRNSPLVAAVLEALAAEAEHVLVELALVVSRDGEAEWFAAPGAEDGAL